MTHTTITLELTRYDIAILAEAVAGEATQAYIDQRLNNSIMLHKVAARLWSHVGNPQKTTKQAALVLAITQELLQGDQDNDA